MGTKMIPLELSKFDKEKGIKSRVMVEVTYEEYPACGRDMSDKFTTGITFTDGVLDWNWSKAVEPYVCRLPYQGKWSPGP